MSSHVRVPSAAQYNVGTPPPPHPPTTENPPTTTTSRYISPLVLSLASLTVPLLAVVEGIMLGVVPPPNALFGVGAFLILVGAATASLVTMLPHKEVFDATDAVEMANDGPQTAGVDKR